MNLPGHMLDPPPPYLSRDLTCDNRITTRKTSQGPSNTNHQLLHEEAVDQFDVCYIFKTNSIYQRAM
jgi:hypothetical protein